jgi:hypothetical protein
LHAGWRVARLARLAGSVIARVTLGAALAAVGFAAYALAAPARDAKIEATRFSADHGLTGALARCPAGRRVVGGGVLKVGRGVLRVGGSGPLDGSRAGAPSNPAEAVANTKDGDVAKRWYAGVANASSRRIRAKALALCSRRSDARVEATSFSVAGRSTADASARCPAGKRAVGGGVVQRSWPDNRVLASAPLDASGEMKNTKDGDVAKQWYVVVHNYPAHRVRFKVFALCSADSRARIEATRSWAKAGGSGHARVKCPSTKRALGGGIIESRRRFLRVLASGPLDATGVPANTRDGDVARLWYGAVENRNPERVRLKVLAICEPG